MGSRTLALRFRSKIIHQKNPISLLGAKFLTRADGSLEEAFPNEGSYCVTALVAFDSLITIDLISNRMSDLQREECIEIVRPWINFLIQSDETHAIISNHLATAVAALVRWNHLMDDPNALRMAELLLERILSNQSEEGWFREYEERILVIKPSAFITLRMCICKKEN